MNKTQLAEAIANEANLTKIDARKAVDAIIKVTADALYQGDKIVLPGFGTFVVVKNPARTGRNFKTGAPIKVGPKNVVKFRPGSELAAKVR